VRNFSGRAPSRASPHQLGWGTAQDAGQRVAAMIEGGGVADVPAEGDVHANVAR